MDHPIKVIWKRICYNREAILRKPEGFIVSQLYQIELLFSSRKKIGDQGLD